MWGHSIPPAISLSSVTCNINIHVTKMPWKDIYSQMRSALWVITHRTAYWYTATPMRSFDVLWFIIHESHSPVAQCVMHPKLFLSYVMDYGRESFWCIHVHVCCLTSLPPSPFLSSSSSLSLSLSLSLSPSPSLSLSLPLPPFSLLWKKHHKFKSLENSRFRTVHVHTHIQST